MSQPLMEIAKQVLRATRKHGARDARVSAYLDESSEVDWRDGQLDRLRESTRRGVSVTLYVAGRYSEHTTSDLRPEALDRFVAENVALTRVLAPDPHRKLPPPERYAGRFAGDLQNHDPAGAQALGAARRKELARQLEQAARDAGGAVKIVSATGHVWCERAERAMLTSNGMEGTRRQTTFGVAAVTSVADKGSRKPSGYHEVQRCLLADLPAAEQVGAEATRRAAEQLGAGPEKSGQYPCVIENRVVGRLLGGVLYPLSGNAIQQRRSFLADQLGQEIAAPALTLIDDPLRPGGMASRPYDGEGMTALRRPVFERGVLKTFYLDTYYAAKLGKDPTTAGPSNLVLGAGPRDLAGLLEAMGTGILITDFSGGNANPATGDFSIGVRGMWVQGGKPARPVAEMNLAGNPLPFWARLAEPGADLDLSSSTVSPSLRFAPVQFSGT